MHDIISVPEVVADGALNSQRLHYNRECSYNIPKLNYLGLTLLVGKHQEAKPEQKAVVKAIEMSQTRGLESVPELLVESGVRPRILSCPSGMNTTPNQFLATIDLFYITAFPFPRTSKWTCIIHSLLCPVSLKQ